MKKITLLLMSVFFACVTFEIAAMQATNSNESIESNANNIKAAFPIGKKIIEKALITGIVIKTGFWLQAFTLARLNNNTNEDLIRHISNIVKKCIAYTDILDEAQFQPSENSKLFLAALNLKTAITQFSDFVAITPDVQEFVTQMDQELEKYLTSNIITETTIKTMPTKSRSCRKYYCLYVLSFIAGIIASGIGIYYKLPTECF